MIKLLLVIGLIILIFVILKNRNSVSLNKSDKYKKIIFIIIILAILFFLATSGRFILPQILQIIKFGLPFLTKFIGI